MLELNFDSIQIDECDQQDQTLYLTFVIDADLNLSTEDSSSDMHKYIAVISGLWNMAAGQYWNPNNNEEII